MSFKRESFAEKMPDLLAFAWRMDGCDLKFPACRPCIHKCILNSALRDSIILVYTLRFVKSFAPQLESVFRITLKSLFLSSPPACLVFRVGSVGVRELFSLGILFTSSTETLCLVLHA